MNRKQTVFVVAGLALLAFIGVVWARAMSVSATSFESNGNLINGSYWLRATGQQAMWTFNAADLAGAKPRSVYLNVQALVTNGTNGGSGYSTTLKVKLKGSGPRTETATVVLHNPYKPQDPAHSGGLGYMCYGSSSSPLKDSLWQQGGRITVTIAYPFTAGRHVAVNRDSVSLGLSR